MNIPYHTNGNDRSCKIRLRLDNDRESIPEDHDENIISNTEEAIGESSKGHEHERCCVMLQAKRVNIQMWDWKAQKPASTARESC